MKIETYQKARLVVEKMDEHYKELDRLYTIRNNTDHYRGEKITIGTNGSKEVIEFDKVFIDAICDAVQQRINSLKSTLDKL